VTFNLPAQEAEEAGVRVAFVLEMPQLVHGGVGLAALLVVRRLHGLGGEPPVDGAHLNQRYVFSR